MRLLLMFRHIGGVVNLVMITLPMVIILVVNGASVNLTFVIKLLLTLILVRIACSIVTMVAILGVVLRE